MIDASELRAAIAAAEELAAWLDAHPARFGGVVTPFASS